MSRNNAGNAWYDFSVAMVFLSSLWLTACDNKPPLQHISLGAPQSLLPSLIWLTDELGFFEEQGIRLELNAYPSGKRSLIAMLEGKEDLAATAETPFAIASFSRDDLRLYATMGQSDNEVSVLARRDHGINTPSDLRNKTIAVQKGSAIHYFLTSFLLYNQLDHAGIQVRFMKAEDLHVALAAGEVDAISMREPYLSLAKDLIGEENLVTFNVPGLYTKSYILVGTEVFETTLPGAMKKILIALNKGAEYADRYPQKAIELISSKLGLPRQRIISLWPEVRLSLTLNQGLLSALQEEAQWVINAGLAQQGTSARRGIPDFLKLINPEPLEAAVPYAVGLVGTNHQ